MNEHVAEPFRSILNAAVAPMESNRMTDDQIKHMVQRFLGWKLPENFRPDAGISFKPTFNEHTAYPVRHEPSGTNLFDFDQATAMVRYMAEGMPDPASHDERGVLRRAEHCLPGERVRLGARVLTVKGLVAQVGAFFVMEFEDADAPPLALKAGDMIEVLQAY